MNKNEIIKLVNECELELSEEFNKVNKICEYNTFKIITNTTFKTVVTFPNQEEAEKSYNDFIDHNTVIELNDNNLEIYVNETKNIGERINVIKNLYTELVYECKKVKK